MAKLPKRDRRHVIGEKAVRAVMRTLPAEWIVREQGGDYGIDIEIELASTEVTGRLLKGQVKGHEGLAWTADKTNLQQVKASTLEYWNQLPLPVVVFLVDVDNETVYWSPGTGASVEPTGVRVLKSSRLPKTTDDLVRFVIDWIDHRTMRQAIYDLPLLVSRLEMARKQVGCDLFMAVDEEDFYNLAALYEQVGLIRRALALRFEMLPWGLWLARARRIFGDSYDLYWGIFDEVVAYLEPIATEAISKAKAQLKSEEPSPANAAAKALAHDHGWRWRFESEFDAEGEEFWTTVERVLSDLGALKLQVKDAKRPKS
jgi:hypothetical protein